MGIIIEVVVIVGDNIIFVYVGDLCIGIVC